VRRAGWLTGLMFLAALASVPAADSVTNVQPYQTYESTVSSDGPVAQYRFDEAAGATTLADSAGTNTAANNGVVLGGAGPFTGSRSGSFASGGYAGLASYPLSTATDFTVEAWVYWSGGSSYGQQVFDFGSGPASYVALTPASALTNHPMVLELRAGAADYLVKAPTLGAKSWHYLAATETGGTLTLYRDGQRVGQTNGVTVTPLSLAPAGNNWLGKSQVSTDPPYNGKLSNVAFYNKALSAAQVLAHYNAAESPVNAALPRITGNVSDGQKLTAQAGWWTGNAPMSYSYQWQRCDSTTGCVGIAGATGSTYVLTSADVGSAIVLLVTANNSAGSGSATSRATPKILAAAPVNTSAPSVSGTATDGQALSASAGSWSGTAPLGYSYQWQSCDPTGANCANVAGATGQTYQLGPGDVGTTLTVVVTTSNGAGSSSATSAASGVVAPAPPSNTVLPAVSGTPQDGQVLTASAGSWSGTAPLSYSYQWQSCDPTGANCANVAGATGQTYQLGPGDVGTTLTVVVTATNVTASTSASSPPSPVVLAIPPSNVSAPTISGTPQTGQTLTATQGLWSGDPVTSYSYQWGSCDATGANCWNIAGASNANYTVPNWQPGQTVDVIVSATNSGGSASSTSVATSPVTAASGSSAPIYFPSSFFAQPVPANPTLDSQSAQMDQDLTDMALGVAPWVSYNCRQATYTNPFKGSTWLWDSNEQAYCHEVNERGYIDTQQDAPSLYTVGPSQPTVPVQGPFVSDLATALSAVPIPPGAQPSPASDGYLIISQPSTDTVWELWKAYQDSSGQWHAAWGGRMQHVSTDPGFYRSIPNTNHACSLSSSVTWCERRDWGPQASRISLLGSMITLDQLASGQVNHVIGLRVTNDRAGAWSWPAQGTDGSGNSIIPQGARLFLDPSLNLDAWFASLKNPDGSPRAVAPIEWILARTLQTYGAVVTDSSGSVGFFTQNWRPTGQDPFHGVSGLFGGLQPYQFMPDLPWEHMDFLQTNMCNAIQSGSSLYQTPCNPPQYINPNPNQLPHNNCPPSIAVSPQPGDTTPPTVTIQEPLPGQAIGGWWQFAASAYDSQDGVKDVVFKVDGQVRYISDNPHCVMNHMWYSVGGAGGSWDASGEMPGPHVLEVDAYDWDGNESVATETVNLP
jgi:hypothetical protein